MIAPAVNLLPSPDAKDQREHFSVKSKAVYARENAIKQRDKAPFRTEL
jgi:hypothetical protein